MQVHRHVEWQYAFLLVVVGVPVVLLVEVEHLGYLQSFPVWGGVGGCDVTDCLVERVVDGASLQGGPL